MKKRWGGVYPLKLATKGDSLIHDKSSPDPLAIHRSALIIDTHVDTPQRLLDESWDFTGPLDSPHGTGHLSLPTAREGNLAAAFFALWAEPTQWKDRHAERTLALLEAVLEQVRKHPSTLQLCTTPDHILTARSQQKFAILLGVEGGHSIENSLDLLRRYHQLGVSYMTLTWSNSNDWAHSSGDAHDHPEGLTPFGRDVIHEMNRLGMMIDVSHSSNQTLADVLATTRAPILATHSAARALTNSHRNLTDDQLRAIAANGGAIMVNFYSAFIDEQFRLALNAQKPERSQAHERLAANYAARNQPIPHCVSNAIDREYAARIPRPPLSSLIDHIDHIARIAGIDHVGIGTDFDGISSTPEGIDSAADLPKVTAALHARGYTPADLHKILGGNLMRVFTEVQNVAITSPQ